MTLNTNSIYLTLTRLHIQSLDYSKRPHITIEENIGKP